MLPPCCMDCRPPPPPPVYSSNAQAWGQNAQGNTGTSLTTNSAGELSPAPVLSLISNNFTLVSAGYQHSCGLDTTGAALCWGYNAYAAVGFGVVGAAHYIPTPVAGGLTFLHVQAGSDFSCGVLSNNSAVCWGELGCEVLMPASQRESFAAAVAAAAVSAAAS